MITYISMGILLLFLLGAVLYKAEYIPEGNNDFFDINNSKAMRGLWCIIVILVHVPPFYQNKIQDLLGSFAYIGVTFFFLTSAYGLVLGAKNKEYATKYFWRRRLPKLIIPNWISNIVFIVVFFLLFGEECNVLQIVNINGWVRWLLICYIAFWTAYYFFKSQSKRNIVVLGLILIVSASFYFLKLCKIVTTTTWCTEIIGFIWGILLACNREKIKEKFVEKWCLKTAGIGVCAVVLGLLYMKFKYVVFFGDYLLKILLGLIILSLILILNSKIKIGNKVICFLGQISFEVYLIHGYSFKLISKIFMNCESGIFILVSIGITVLFATVIHVFCKWILSKVQKCLCA